MYRKYLFILVSFLSLALSQTEKLRISILEFENKIKYPDTDESSAGDILRERIETLIVQSGRYSVISSTERDKILKEQKFQTKSGCVDESCAVEIGQMLGAEAMVVGSIGKIGSIYTFTAKMFDVETGAIKSVGSYETSKEIEDLLIEGASDVIGQLIGRSYDSQQPNAQDDGSEYGTISILTDPPGIVVLIDGTLIDSPTPINGMKIKTGRHTLVLKSKEYERVSQIVDITKDTNKEINLIMAIKSGSLIITNDKISDVKVYIDNQYRGKNPLDIELPYGSHAIRFEKEFYKVKEDRITISDEPQTIAPSMIPKDVKVEFITKPSSAGATLTLDRKRWGEISSDGLILPLQPKMYSLSIKSKNFETYTESFIVRPGNYIEKKIELNLKSKKKNKNKTRDNRSKKNTRSEREKRKNKNKSKNRVIGFGASYGLPGMLNYHAKIGFRSNDKRDIHYIVKWSQNIIKTEVDMKNDSGDATYGHVSGMGLAFGIGPRDYSFSINGIGGSTRYEGFDLINDTYYYIGASLEGRFSIVFLELGAITDLGEYSFYDSSYQIFFQAGVMVDLKF